jgi:hypothetical protein
MVDITFDPEEVIDNIAATAQHSWNSWQISTGRIKQSSYLLSNVHAAQ